MCIRDRFYCKLCSTKDWVFENKDSLIPERPVCRCDNCLADITQAEQRLHEAMATNDFHTLNSVFSQIKNDNTDIDVQLFHQAEVLHLKLEKELDIKNFIKSVEHVDDYKTIRKSVKVLNDKYQNAEKLGVEVDPQLISQINDCSHRLISERDLRFEMENMYVSASTTDTVQKLQDLISEANKYSVEKVYMDKANNLCGKMEDNILARDTLQMLLNYPIREYPEPDPVDAKGKPIKQKDDKKKGKKKKKKEPKFDMPDWATNLEDVQKTVKKIADLASRAEELHLEPAFLQQTEEQLARFKMEINYRKMKEEEERLEAEAKLLAKKKKKK